MKKKMIVCILVAMFMTVATAGVNAVTDSKQAADAYAAQTKAMGFGTDAGETSIVVSATGDCVLGSDETFSYRGSFMERFNLVKKDYGYFFRDVKPIFENDNLSVVNLETALTNATIKKEKEYRFKGLPGFANILKYGGIEAANISNNHTHDYLEQGFRDTLSSVSAAGIKAYGEGIAYTQTINGIRTCILGYRLWEDSKWMRSRIKRDIAYYKNKKYDVVIVSFHWGVEWTNIPTALQQSIGRFTLDSGADLVIGHHPHVMQSIECYKGKYIVYSLGNFCYGGIENPSDRDTFVFQQKFVVKNGKSTKDSRARIIPCLITAKKTGNDYKPVLACGADKERIMERLAKYSKSFKVLIDKDGILK